MLRQRHRDDLAALAVHAAAAEKPVVAQEQRAAALAAADQTVKAASADLFAATSALVARIGIEAAAEATGTDVDTVARIVKSTGAQKGR
jgi:hypothetical protein